MRKFLLILLAAMLLCLPALAEELTFSEPLTGVYIYPEGASEEEATYLYRFSYPQIAGESDVAAIINTTYHYTADDTLGFEAPMNAGLTDGAAYPTRINVSFEITCQTADYLSVLVTKVIDRGTSQSTLITGHVFALTGDRAGEIISLPYLLGILTHADQTDTWLADRQTAKADECIREMLWETIQEQMADGAYPFFDELLYEEFEASFYPEEDFYLDENGNPIFYLQPNAIADPEAGALLYPLTLEDIFDEL